MRLSSNKAICASVTIIAVALPAAGCAGFSEPPQSSTGSAQVTPDTTVNVSVTTAPLAAFEGMWSYELGDEHHEAELCGYLIIEEPYVHVLATEHGWDPNIDPGLSRKTHDESLYYFWINLPRSGTRYDPRTRSIWVWDDGPMTDGDHVSLGGSAGADNISMPSDIHRRESWLATSMVPTERPC